MSAERDLLAEIWLYVSFEYVSKQLDTEGKELWADCIDQWQPDPDHPEERQPMTRWWRDCDGSYRCGAPSHIHGCFRSKATDDPRWTAS